MVTETIQLNLINKSSSEDVPSVVIFQRNVVVNTDEPPIAWRVISNIGSGNNHPFDLSQTMQVSARIESGNVCVPKTAEPGQVWELIEGPSGIVLILKPDSDGATDMIKIENNLPAGTAELQAYRDNLLLATAFGVAPTQTAHFLFGPDIFVTTMVEITQGAAITVKLRPQDLTEFCLTGISSADIIMTDGPSGAGAPVFNFHLENVERLPSK